MTTNLRTLEQRRGQWLKGVLDLCVLGMLRDREAYGYELGQDLEFAGLGPIKGGTLYPVLSRLEDEGFLETSWRASDLGPDRKYYRITPAGTDVVNEMGKAWSTFSDSVGTVLSDGGGSR